MTRTLWRHNACRGSPRATKNPVHGHARRGIYTGSVRKAPSVRPSCRALGGWHTALPARDSCESRPPSSSRWQVRRVYAGDQVQGDRGLCLRGQQIRSRSGHSFHWRPPGHARPVHSRLPCGRLRTPSHSIVRVQSVRGHVTCVPAVPERHAVARVCRPHRLCARVRADAPCLCPGRLRCSWACQDLCVQLWPIQICPRSCARSMTILHAKKGAHHACRGSRYPCRPPACCVRSGAGAHPVRVAGRAPALYRVLRPYAAAVAATLFLRKASYARPMGGTVCSSHVAHTSLPDAVGAGGQKHSTQGRPVGPSSSRHGGALPYGGKGGLRPWAPRAKEITYGFDE